MIYCLQSEGERNSGRLVCSALKQRCIQPSYAMEVEGPGLLWPVNAGEYKNLISELF